ncbi:MAG: YbhB/YbcL family Raf kinase inhibitor-like protein [Bacteroidota bacterium]
METTTQKLTVQSPSFGHNGHIPVQYTCEGDNINPSIEISDIPGNTKTLALIMEDPDAPSGIFVHWLMWNFLPSEPITERSNLGVSGINDFGKTGYGGPCPPSGTHRYFFKIYALDKELSVTAGESKNALLECMEGHILATGELMGRYRKGSVKNKSSL